jgi:hypothetical protein
LGLTIRLVYDFQSWNRCVNGRIIKAREAVVTSVEPVTPLEVERSVFDSAETRILSAAFEKAWAYVEFDPMLGILDLAERQAELARALMAILKIGETNPTSLANSGIALLHRAGKTTPDRGGGPGHNAEDPPRRSAAD